LLMGHKTALFGNGSTLVSFENLVCVCGVFVCKCRLQSPSARRAGGWSRNKGPVWALLLGDRVV